MLQGMKDGVFALGAGGELKLWNAAAQGLFGVPAHAVTPSTLRELLGAELCEALLRGDAIPSECALRRADGHTFPALLEVTPLRDSAGALQAVACVVRERSTERRLQARAQKQQALAELAQGLLAGGPLEWILNEACQHLLEAAGAAQVGVWRARADGAAFELIAGAGWQPGTVGQLFPAATDGVHLACAFREGRPQRLETLLAGGRLGLPGVLEGHQVQAGVAAQLCIARKGWGVVAVYGAHPFEAADVELVEAAANVLALALERTSAEDRLRQNEARIRELMEQVPDGLAVWNDQRQLLLANRAALEMLGAKDLLQVEGRPLEEVLTPEVVAAGLERVRRCIEARAPLPPHDYRLADGRVIETESVPFEFGGGWAALTVSRDVTERRQLEARAMVADRLASVGLLAAGVAHELNNPLAWMLSNLRYLDEELSEVQAALKPELKEALADATQGAERMAVIVRDLKTFSRAEDESQAPVALERVVDAALKLAGPEVRQRAKLVTRLGTAPQVLGSDARMGQVVVNLIINASQAIPEGEGQAHEVSVALGTGADGWAELTVRDTGGGIDPAHLSRIFEPFFTTKPIGEGTGLGLTVCHGVVTRMGGTITVESSPGRGTEVRLRFPPAPRVGDEAQPEPANERSRRGRVLVVDDEGAICTAFVRILGSRHDVRVCESAEAALALIDAGEVFDVIFCDVMMPGLGGPGFRNAIEGRHPALRDRVIYMTGGAYTSSGRALLDEAGDGQLEKPFEPAKVRALVTERLRAGLTALADEKATAR